MPTAHSRGDATIPMRTAAVHIQEHRLTTCGGTSRLAHQTPTAPWHAISVGRPLYDQSQNPCHRHQWGIPLENLRDCCCFSTVGITTSDRVSAILSGYRTNYPIPDRMYRPPTEQSVSTGEVPSDIREKGEIAGQSSAPPLATEMCPASVPEVPAVALLLCKHEWRGLPARTPRGTRSVGGVL